MKQILNTRRYILNNKKTYKIGATTSLALLLAACGSGVTVPTEGDDVFLATAEPDIIDGLGGVDTISYINSTASINISLFDDYFLEGYAQDDDLTNIENIIGSAFNDVIAGDDQDNMINGGDGNDTIFSGDGNNTIFGGNGNDSIVGYSGDDFLAGDAGDDVLRGGAGADVINGGAGNDTVSYISLLAVNINLLDEEYSGGDAQGDTLSSIENIIGSWGDDTLRGDNNNNDIDGSLGNDIIFGRDGDDVLYGRSGNDTLRGGSGADTLYGGPDDDNINGDTGNDIIEGGEGADVINGGDGVDTASYASSSALVNISLLSNIYSGGDADGDTLTNIENIIGSAGNDVLRGDDDDNVIDGGAGNDTLSGFNGNDILNGGNGNDILTGSAGNDSIDGGMGVDTIRIADVNATFVIDQLNDKIIIVSTDGLDDIASIEIIELGAFPGTPTLIQDIWNQLSLTDRNDFGNNEANFLSWLGDDDGYNYEGL